MKKVTLITTSLLLLVTLAACGQSADSKTGSASSKSTSVSRKTSKKKQSSSATATGSVKLNQSASSTKKETATKATITAKQTVGSSMDLAKIKQGDYHQLVGTWHQIATAYNRSDSHGMRYRAGGDGLLTVGDSSMTNGSMTLRTNELTDDAGSHPINYKLDKGILDVSLSDADKVAINWGVTFYPKGTTNEFKTDANSKKNTENLIKIWTSNNQYTEVFAQSTAATKATSQKLNLAQLADNDFSSLVGRWKNPAGKVITVTNQVAKRPADSYLAITEGAVISEKDSAGHQQVIGTGKVQNNIIQGSMGSFSNQTLDPLTIVPAGVKAATGDDSNTQKDRLIAGGGQGGYAQSAYYRD